MSPKRSRHPLDEAALVELARAALDGLVTLEQDGPVTVTAGDDGYVVEFGTTNPPGVRGPDFEARVMLTRTGTVREVLAGS